MKMGKYDIAIIIVLFSVGVILLGYFFLHSSESDKIEVRVSGEVVKVFNINSDTKYRIKGVGGENLLIIRNGAAYIDSASCPDGLCIHMGKITKNGQSIVCLPNEVVVEVMGESKVDSMIGR